MKTAIVIIKYGAERAFRACMESVRRCTADSTLVIVHNNLPEKENLGKLWNRLICDLPKDVRIVVLLNPDTVVSSRWSEELAAGISAGHTAVGPMTNRCGFPKQISRGPDRRHGFLEVQALSGFCVAIDRGAFEQLGGFREDFPLYGQDSDLFMRMRRSSMSLAIARHVFVRHERSVSSREAQKRGEINLARAKKKAVKMYAEAVRRQRQIKPRVLGIVRSGPGQEASKASLCNAGMDEIHIVPSTKVKQFIKSRERFFEAVVSLAPGQFTDLNRERALAIASNGGGPSVIRLPRRK